MTFRLLKSPYAGQKRNIVSLSARQANVSLSEEPYYMKAIRQQMLRQLGVGST